MRNALIWAAGALALVGCGEPARLAVDGAWVRLNAVPGRPAAAYFTLHGGAADATLIAVRTSAARRAELHEGMAAGMRPITTCAVPAGATVAFAPGGRHAMLYDVDPSLTAGKQMTLSFAFGDGRTLAARARIVAAGDAAP